MSINAASTVAAARSAPNSVPTFYINRDCDHGRRESVCAYLAAAELPAERVPGVEGLAVPAQFRSFFFEGEKLHSKLKPGEVGCYASHLVAMQMIVDRGLDYALILEDDAVLPADTTKTLADILRTVPKGWDLVHFCRETNRAVKVIADLDDNRRLIRFSRVPETTTGYLVSRSGAQKFLKPMKRYWPIDTDFRQPWRFGLEIYGVTPCFIHAEGFESAIHHLGDHSRLRRGLPIPSRHCWTGNPLHTPSGVLFNVRKHGPVTWATCATRNVAHRLAKTLHLGPIMQKLGLGGTSPRPAEGLAGQ
ncbi:MAG: glycosyltransferase family 25 protein [Hyphomicrobium sp.]